MANQVQTQGNEITAAAEPRPIEKFRQSFLEQKGKMEKVLPAHITFEKFHSVVMMACMANPQLITADRGSLMLSCVKAATDGLLPDQREAALVIFNAKLGYKDDSGKDVYGQKVQYMPMYAGVLKKARQSKEISSITTHVVYQIELDKKLFTYALGDEERIEHTPYIGPEDRGPVALAYCIAKLKDGTVVREVMTRADIEKVRRSSKSGSATDKDVQWKKAAHVGDPVGIWKDWYEEMARKTVFRRAAKWLPQSVDKEGNTIRLFDNDDTMEAIEGIEATESYTIEHDEDGVVIENEAEGQPDLKKAVEEKKAETKKLASKKVEKPEPEAPADEAKPKDLFEIEQDIRKAVNGAKDYNEAYDLISVDYAADIARLHKEKPAAGQSLQAWITAQMKDKEGAPK